MPVTVTVNVNPTTVNYYTTIAAADARDNMPSSSSSSVKSTKTDRTSSTKTNRTASTKSSKRSQKDVPRDEESIGSIIKFNRDGSTYSTRTQQHRKEQRESIVHVEGPLHRRPMVTRSPGSFKRVAIYHVVSGIIAVCCQIAGKCPIIVLR